MHTFTNAYLTARFRAAAMLAKLREEKGMSTIEYAFGSLASAALAGLPGTITRPLMWARLIMLTPKSLETKPVTLSITPAERHQHRTDRDLYPSES